MWIVFDVLSFRKDSKNVRQSHFYWKSDIISESLTLASICNKNSYSSLSIIGCFFTFTIRIIESQNH